MPNIRSIPFEDQQKIGIWHITEPAEYFLDLLDLSTEEWKEFSTLKNDRRKTEWLAARYILHQISQQNNRIFLEKDKFGKPAFQSEFGQLSLSHTDAYAAAVLHQNPCGIDIQSIKNTVLKILKRVLSPTEISSIPVEDDLIYGTMYWSAKEAIFKAHGIGNIDYRKDIEIHPFEWSGQNFHSSAKLNYADNHQTYTLKGFKFENNIVITAVQNI